MPEHVPENGAFVAHLIRSRRRDGDGLSVHHLAHHASRRVGRAHQDRIEAELLRRDPLQAAEQRVGRRVAARQGHAQPSQERAEEGIEPSAAREREPKHRVEPGIARGEPQAQHERDRDDRELHALERVPEDLRQLPRPQAQHQAGQDGRDETPRPRRREPVEIEPCRLGCQLRHDRRRARHRVVQQRDIPHGRGRAVDRALDRRQAPHEHRQRQDGERHPRFDHLTGGMLVRGRTGPRPLLVREAPHAPRPPKPEEDHRRGERHDPAAMSTRFESTWLDQRYCVRLNEAPTTRMAGSTSRVSAHPTMARTSQKGTMIPVMGRMRPIMALKSDSGRPETAARVCTGVPIAPHATGDVLAIKLSAAAWNGLNPSPIMKAPAIATGAPKPAAPSMNAPKQNATSSNCSRRSAVIPATDSFMISNWPVNTEMSYRYTAASTIHAIFSTPNPTPYRKLMPASDAGIPKTSTATSTAVAAPAMAHQWGFTRNPASRPNSTRIGSAATRVEKTQLCSGS